MRKAVGTRFAILFIAAILALWPTTHASKNKALQIYFIDVEGGQSTLFVAPNGQSMLVDTGWPGGRDADRIVEVAKKAGIKQIDYLVVTHYHVDHAGGVADLASRIPIRTFIDHGANVEEAPATADNYNSYLPVRARGNYILARPGSRLPIAGIDVQIVSAAGKTITKPLAGAGHLNPLCRGFEPKDGALVGGENQQSVGMIVTLGKFRMADFGDLTWNREYDLACPRNLLGAVDLYLVSHHGREISGLPMLVYAMRPRVAIMNNGAHKGGDVLTFERLKKSPGLESLWQLHYEVAAAANNMPEEFIANTGISGTVATGVPGEVANYIMAVAQPDGSFTVDNSRNSFQKKYGPH